MTKKVLVVEEVADEVISALEGRGYEVDVKLGLSSQELVEAIEPYDALIIRSATKVTEELLDAAKNLKIIGRAGVTVDNIDIASAAEHDVIVCNASAIASWAPSCTARPWPSSASGAWDRRWPSAHLPSGCALWGMTRTARRSAHPRSTSSCCQIWTP